MVENGAKTRLDQHGYYLIAFAINCRAMDDWGPDRRDLMEIVEDKYEVGSTLITSQSPIDAWHDVIEEPTFADAILDRLAPRTRRLPRRTRGPEHA
jgi:DNA replication protein DnaC